jgi:hypothetical protein
MAVDTAAAASVVILLLTPAAGVKFSKLQKNQKP